MIINENELIIYKKIEVLYFRIYPVLRSFPKSEKFSLVQEIRTNFLELMKFVLMQNNVRSKRKTYQELQDGHLQICKILISLSYEQKYISFGFYRDTSVSLSEIGKMMGSWIRS